MTSWISETFYITDEFTTHVVGWLVDGGQKRRQFGMNGNMCDFNHFTCLNCDLVLNKSKTLTLFIWLTTTIQHIFKQKSALKTNANKKGCSGVQRKRLKFLFSGHICLSEFHFAGAGMDDSSAWNSWDLARTLFSYQWQNCSRAKYRGCSVDYNPRDTVALGGFGTFPFVRLAQVGEIRQHSRTAVPPLQLTDCCRDNAGCFAITWSTIGQVARTPLPSLPANDMDTL